MFSSKTSNKRTIDLIKVDEFRARFLAGEILLSHKRYNEYIKNKIEEIGYENILKTLVTIKGVENDIELIAIPGLLKFTGLSAHIGLGRYYGKTVIYIDSDLYYNEDIRQHEFDEISGWEALKKLLALEPREMRKWILDNIETPVNDERLPPEYKGKTSRQIAYIIHGSSHHIYHIYKQYADTVDYEYLAALTAYDDETAAEKDIAIAASRQSRALKGKTTLSATIANHLNQERKVKITDKQFLRYLKEFNHRVVYPEEFSSTDEQWLEFIKKANKHFIDLALNAMRRLPPREGMSSNAFIYLFLPSCPDNAYLKRNISGFIWSRFKIPSEAHSASEACEILFNSEHNTRAFFELASILRESYPFEISIHDQRPPLQYAQENGIVFSLGQNLFITPITEAFRRHIVFGKDKDGRIIFAFEIFIPGKLADRHNVEVEARKSVANDINSDFHYKDYCVEPFFDKQFSDGRYKFYGTTFDFGYVKDFGRTIPLRAIAFEYKEDGKRLNHISSRTLEELAKARGESRRALEIKIVKRVADLTAAIHSLHWLGRGDLHAGNLRFIRKGNDFTITLVDDFDDFVKWRTHASARYAMERDIKFFIEGPHPENPMNNLGLCHVLSLSKNQIYSIFRERYNNINKGSPTASIDAIKNNVDLLAEAL